MLFATLQGLVVGVDVLVHPALFTAAHQVALRLKGALTVELNEVSGATDTSMLRESMLGSRHQPKRAGRALALLFGLLLTLVSACKDRPPKVPGESDIRVAEVTIESAAPQSDLALEHGALFDRLGERPGSLINPDRMWSPFREAEDRRRIEAFWQQYGYFDVEVANAVTTFDSEDGPARVTFKVRENGRYKVASVHLQAAPPEEQTTLEAMIPFKKGDSDIDLERFRKTRIDMAELLRRRAFGHANVYSRFYVDKTAKTIDVYLFVDAGPKTTIGSVRVDGAVKIPEADVVRRSGLSVGEPYTEDLRDRVVRDLMDSGAYSAAYVRVDTDTPVLVRLERLTLKKYRLEAAPQTTAAPVTVALRYPSGLRAGGAGSLEVAVRGEPGARRSFIVRVPLPPGVTVAEAVSGVEAMPGLILIKVDTDDAGIAVPSLVPLRFSLGGNFLAPPAEITDLDDVSIKETSTAARIVVARAP